VQLLDLLEHPLELVLGAMQLLDLLEHPLELVLGAMQLPGEPGAKSLPIRVSAATFSAVCASSAPKLGFDTASSKALAVRDSMSS